MSSSMPPVTPPGSRTPLPLATPPIKRPPNPTGSNRRPSQCLPHAVPPASNHAPLSQTCSLSPHMALTSPHSSKPQPTPPAAVPENGPEETTTLLSEQQNCVGPRRPSHTQVHAQSHVHTITHTHTESTI